MTETADTRWLSDTELAAWIPLSGMLIGLLAADKTVSGVEVGGGWRRLRRADRENQ